MEELAVFGGKPVREKPIFYGRQYIDQEDVEAVTKVLTADVITSGPQVSDLEKHLCEITHAKYAVAVCNGTAALHLAALAAGFGEGDEVYRKLHYICGFFQLCIICRCKAGLCGY